MAQSLTRKKCLMRSTGDCCGASHFSDYLKVLHFSYVAIDWSSLVKSFDSFVLFFKSSLI